MCVEAQFAIDVAADGADRAIGIDLDDDRDMVGDRIFRDGLVDMAVVAEENCVPDPRFTAQLAVFAEASGLCVQYPGPHFWTGIGGARLPPHPPGEVGTPKFGWATGNTTMTAGEEALLVRRLAAACGLAFLF